MSEETIFSKEEKTIEEAEAVLNSPEFKQNPFFQPYHDLLGEYKKLFRQTRRLVKMSDRMQKDLNELNAELQKHKEILSQMSYFCCCNREHRRCSHGAGQKTFI
ncbi:MAG: hypothetical protein ACLFNW_06775 [Desulfobacterales bacterium]